MTFNETLLNYVSLWILTKIGKKFGKQPNLWVWGVCGSPRTRYAPLFSMGRSLTVNNVVCWRSEISDYFFPFALAGNQMVSFKTAVIIVTGHYKSREYFYRWPKRRISLVVSLTPPLLPVQGPKCSLAVGRGAPNPWTLIPPSQGRTACSRERQSSGRGGWPTQHTILSNFAKNVLNWENLLWL